MAYLGVVLQVLVVAYLVLVEPFYGKRLYAHLVRSAADDPRARSRFYRQTLVLEWGLVALALLSLWLRKQPLAALGLQPWALANDGVQGMMVGVMGGALIGIVLSVILAAVSATARGTLAKQLQSVRPLLPVTAGERWQFAGVSVTAGICEELLFRGLFLLAWRELFPGAPDWAAVVVLGLLFGAAHLYQGWLGVLATGLLGIAFMALYVTIHSLYPLMVLRALIDLRVLALTLVTNRGRTPGAPL